MIRTERLLLVPARERDLEADLVSHEALAESLGASVPEDWPPEFYDEDAIHYTLNQLRTSPSAEGYGFYYVTLPGASGRPSRLIGACGFKSEPQPNGEVELGYGIIASERLKGNATEATRGMCDFAFSDPRTQIIVAQTIPSLVGSIAVMEKAGFTFDGAGNDESAPEGEQVLRYVLRRD